MVNLLTQNNVEQREDDLEKEKGMDRGGKVTLLLAVLDSPLLKASKATTNYLQ